MKRKKQGLGSGTKIVLAAAGMIASGAFLFGGLSEVVLAAEAQKVEQVPTSYTLTVLPEAVLPLATSSVPETASDGYKKPSYTVEKGEYDDAPAAKDISMEQAADIGAKELWKIYGAGLEGATITMQYFPADKYFPRSYWYGAAQPAGEKASLQNPGISHYDFMVDAVTGNVLCNQVMRFVDGPEIAGFSGFDKSLSKDPYLYTEKAKELAEELGLFNGKVKAVEYVSQGYLNNDPNATIALTGEDGRRAKLGISRHDHTLIGVQYEEWMVFSELGNEAFREDIRKEEQRLMDLIDSGEVEANEDGSVVEIFKSDASPLMQP